MASEHWQTEIKNGRITPLRISDQTLEFLPEISKKFHFFVIDGIVFDASIGHVCSCIGLDSSNLGIQLAPKQQDIKDFDPLEFIHISTYINSAEIRKKFDERINFLVLKAILRQIYEDDEFKFLQIVVRNPDSEPPLLMAKCI